MTQAKDPAQTSETPKRKIGRPKQYEHDLHVKIDSDAEYAIAETMEAEDLDRSDAARLLIARGANYQDLRH